VEPLIGALGDANVNIRSRAAEALGSISDPRAIQPLIAVLGVPSNSDYQVINSAVQALRGIGGPAVEPLIGALMHSKDERVRGSVATALGEIGDHRAVEPLIGALSHEKEDVRISAAWALGKIGDNRAVEPLIGVLGNANIDGLLSEAAAIALGNFGDTRAVEPLIGTLAAVYSYRFAAEALCKIGEPAILPLTQALSHQDSNVRIRAADTLRKIRPATPVVPRD
jgi:HEAT repeat protein